MQLRVHGCGFYFKVMGSHGWSLNNKKVCNNFESVCVVWGRSEALKAAKKLHR